MAAEPTSVLDAFALIAYQRGERAAKRVAELIRDRAAITAVNAAEVVDRAVRVSGAEGDDIEAEIAMLGIRVDAVTAAVGFDAGRLRATYYAAKTSEVSLGDCVAAAHALRLALPLATADEPLAMMVESEGGTVIRLPRPA
jgi:PIN domain nuclease of toxin-antitoxin system